MALASGPTPSALALVRMSGPQCRAIIEALSGCPVPPARQLVRRHIRDAQGQAIDDAMLVFLPGPANFTGEDSAEITTHGGPAVVGHLLQTLTAMTGVRLAEPGEFTRRAFEAGKLDLTQAEAIADLIAADTPLQKDMALRQLDGAMSRVCGEISVALGEALALCEAMIDFSDEGDVPDDLREGVRHALKSARAAIGRALDDDHAGQRVREGVRIAIIGAPNAGKSTLLNRLAGRDAAIVTPIPGTTRDVIDVRLVLAGVPVTVSDTAGLRETSDAIEAEGVRRARLTAENADIRIWVAESMVGMAEWPDAAGENDLLVRTKADLVATDDQPSPEATAISALTGAGMEAFLSALVVRVAQSVAGAGSAVVTRERHRIALRAAQDRVDAALAGVAAGSGVEWVAEDIRAAHDALDRLIGRLDMEAVLGAIFSRFCVGK